MPTAAQARAFIVLMGVVSLFGDMTYEGARGLVGPYLGLLGASAATIGFYAGLGEFLGYALRLLTGWLGDRTRAYWPLTIAGYATNLVVIAGLAWVGTWQAAVALLLLERIGKAVRSPSRSTLVSYAATQAGAGKSFGLEEALDQIGAVSGPLCAALVMWVVRARAPAERYQLAFWVLLLPVFANLALVLAARRKYPRPETFEDAAAAPPAGFGGLFRWFLVGAALFGLGFADWALVSYHAGKLGLFDAALLPVLYAGAMGVDALAALLFGRLFDRIGLGALALSCVVSAAFAPLVFWRPSLPTLLAGAALWSVGMGAQESIFKAAIATMVAKHERARAYGIFFAVFGLAWWAGSALMGALYEAHLSAMILFSVATQLAAVPVFLVLSRRLRRR